MVKKKKGVCQGYTLIEIIISIAILSLVFVLFSINFSFLNKLLLRSQADKLFSTFVYLQRRAISTGSEQVLKFDAEKNQYSYNGKIFNLNHKVFFGFYSDVNGPPSSPILPIKSSVTFKDNTAKFYSDGVIDSGTIYLRDIDGRFLYAISSGVAKIAYPRKYYYNFANSKWVLIT